MRKLLRMVLIACALCSVTMASAQETYYSSDIHVGYGFTNKVEGFKTYQGRVALGTVQGVGCKYGDAGIGVDAVMYTHYYKDDGLRFTVVPYVSLRPAYSFSDKFAVMFDGAIGYYFPVLNWKDGIKGGMFFRYGAGIRLSRLTLTGGLEQYRGGYVDNSEAKGTVTPYVKLGINLGKSH